MDYEGFLNLVKTRRSSRSFKADPIPDEYVERSHRGCSLVSLGG